MQSLCATAATFLLHQFILENDLLSRVIKNYYGLSACTTIDQVQPNLGSKLKMQELYVQAADIGILHFYF